MKPKKVVSNPIEKIKKVAKQVTPVAPESEISKSSESSERRETLRTSSGDVIISRIDDDDDSPQQNPFIKLQNIDKENTVGANSLDSATDGLNN